MRRPTRSASISRSRTCYLERFSNQAEAIKAFEKSPRARPAQPVRRPITCSRCTRSAATGEAHQAQRGRGRAPPGRARRQGPRRSRRWRRPRSRSRRSPPIWWKKVIQYEPTHEEALTELYKLYERNKEWKARGHLVASGRRRERTRRPAPTRCSASACSTPRRSRTARRRSSLAAACSRSTRTTVARRTR